MLVPVIVSETVSVARPLYRSHPHHPIPDASAAM